MAFESEKALSGANVPDFGGVIETTCQQFVAICVEMKRDDFGLVPRQSKDLLARLHIPKLGSVVHGARSHKHAVWIEGETHNFHLVALKSVVALPCRGIPNLGFFVEGTSHDFVTKLIKLGDAYPNGLLKAMQYTTFECSSSESSSCPEFVSQTLQVLS